MITSKRRGKNRFFYENKRKIAHYDIEDDTIRGIKANIYLEDRKMHDGSHSIGIYAVDWQTIAVSKIKEFLRVFLGVELGIIVYDYLLEDFSIFDKIKEKVIFT